MSKSLPCKCCNECFNCFQFGRCEYWYWIKLWDKGSQEADARTIYFCSKPCWETYVHDEAAFWLAENQRRLDKLSLRLTEAKATGVMMVEKKHWVSEKMLRTSLAKRKPKAELYRLFALYQECATDSLTHIGDVCKEVVVLDCADTMKQNGKTFTTLIEMLGR